MTFRGAAAIQLRPLDANAVRGYLCDDAGGPVAKARWDPVLEVLGTQAPVAQALETPLMVGLARAIYNPRPGEPAEAVRNPAELCTPDLPDRAAVESLLFDEFIPAAYRHGPAGRWKAQDAEKWLVFLARHLERKIAGPDLAWWQLRRSMPCAAVGAVVVAGAAAGVAAGVLAGLGIATLLLTLAVVPEAGLAVVAGVVTGLAAGLAAGAGVAAGVVDGLAGQSSAEAPAHGVRISAGVGVLAGWLVAVLALGVLLRDGLEIGVLLGGGPAVVTVLVLGMGPEGVPDDLAEAASPRAVLARDRRMALLLALADGVVAGVAVGVLAGSGAGLAAGLAVGLAVGAGVGLGLSARQTAWPSYLLTMGWLAFSHRLPRSLMGFLADAHQRGVLRQAGTVYQFRHIDLQHRLATRNVGKGRSSMASGSNRAPDSGTSSV